MLYMHGRKLINELIIIIIYSCGCSISPSYNEMDLIICKAFPSYCIYSIKHPGALIKFLDLETGRLFKVGTYSRWALI